MRSNQTHPEIVEIGTGPAGFSVTLPSSLTAGMVGTVFSEYPFRIRATDSRFPTGSMECLVSTFTLPNGRQIFVLTEVEDNPGPSVTNAADVLVPALYNAIAGAPPEQTMFIEHYCHVSGGDHEETFDHLRIEKKEGADSVSFAGWSRISPLNLAA